MGETQEPRISDSPAEEDPSASSSEQRFASSPVSDRVIGVIVWIGAGFLLLPVFVFVYVYFIRNRLLGG